MSDNKIQSLRGMKDLIDDDSVLYSYFIKHASLIAKNYGFSYIQTPILEETALFKRSVGNSSDIVNKEMYQFIDKGTNDVCLRPEGTAGVVRAFIQDKKDRAGKVCKWYYHGSMFRYERPQKGRLRQFHQFGAEVFGLSSVYEDANIIMMLQNIFDFFSIKYTLLLNSLGCSSCMPEYKINLENHLKDFKDELCEDCQVRSKTNLIRILDCKNDTCKSLLKDAPKITNNLCSSCDDDFKKLKEILDFNKISYKIDSNLVRGLDYYSKTTFEFISNQIGAQSAIAGGGRYDKLVEFLGGRQTPAIGFAIGIERLLELIKIKEEKEDTIYMGVLDENSLNTLVKVAYKKRLNTKVILEYTPRTYNKHFKLAQKAKANIIALLGSDDLEKHTIYVKNLSNNEEKTIKIEDF